MPVASRALEMVHDTDPRKEIEDSLSPYLDEIEVMGARVLIGVYVRPSRTRGGIIIADSTRNEDNYQGKIGLVLKLGPLAFTADATHDWGDRAPKVGDWVLFRVGDTHPLIIGDRACRLAEDVAIQAVVGRPDMVF